MCKKKFFRTSFSIERPSPTPPKERNWSFTEKNDVVFVLKSCLRLALIQKRDKIVCLNVGVGIYLRGYLKTKRHIFKHLHCCKTHIVRFKNFNAYIPILLKMNGFSQRKSGMRQKHLERFHLFPLDVVIATFHCASGFGIDRFFEF